MNRAALGTAVFVALVLSAFAVRAAEPETSWPQLLGPHRNGISDEKGLNLDWKTYPPKTLWKVAVGSGYSSLAVRGDYHYKRLLWLDRPAGTIEAHQFGDPLG